MAMGQKINDHSFWAGGSSKQSVLAQGVKHKAESSAEGAGMMSEYEDTTEAIKKQQSMTVSNTKSHKQKDHYRN